eukprot:COSAG06_NODE_12520_length_1369_cov_2.144094_1_plen_121_part_00
MSCLPRCVSLSHPRLRTRSSSWGRRCVLCVRVCIGALLSCPAGSGLLLLPCFCFRRLRLSFSVSDPLLGVLDGNDTNNQPTQGPRHYDTLTTKNFYGQLLSQDLEDERAALPVKEEVVEA